MFGFTLALPRFVFGGGALHVLLSYENNLDQNPRCFYDTSSKIAVRLIATSSLSASMRWPTF